MSAKPISEFDAKTLVCFHLGSAAAVCAIHAETHSEAHVRFAEAETQHPWLQTTMLVVKPDQLIKRRGKLGLVAVNLTWENAKTWILARVGTSVHVENTVGVLDTFIVEPFVKHAQDMEFYICIQSLREGDLIYFSHKGGVDVGNVDEHALKLLIPPLEPHASQQQILPLLANIPSPEISVALLSFIQKLYTVFAELHFTYLEINPLVAVQTDQGFKIVLLDLAAKLDQTAEHEVGKKWVLARTAAYPSSKSSGGPEMKFPAPFGRKLSTEEAYIAELDSKTGASLKLTIMNSEGRIWTMVAGGGASVVYSDAIAAYGFAKELANYGEYSGTPPFLYVGAPSESQTFEYAKTILGLMTRGEVRSDGKILFIGGGIANFTNVASTFKGIIRALKEFQIQLQTHKVKIYVRRAGPNWQEGLRLMRELGDILGVEMHVFGPESHVTGIVPLALQNNSKGVLSPVISSHSNAAVDLLSIETERSISALSLSQSTAPLMTDIPEISNGTSGPALAISFGEPEGATFTQNSQSFIYGMQPKAVQGMLDFDFMCKRTKPSVACMIYPFGGHHVQKVYWGTTETLVPVYTSISEAASRFPDVEIVINFASSRSVYESTMEMLSTPQIKTIAIIAEGVPERRAREILWTAKQKDVLIIGPATVGGIKPGCFKIGNTGGMTDNIISSKLYRAGSVAYVSKSGGMSNELNNIISRHTDGVYEGVAIGGDRYPGSTFIDHILRYEKADGCKMIVLLGEVGGDEEYRVAEAVKNGTIKKPIVAWCIGTCASMFTTDVQFGHAGSFANSNRETADAKNSVLRASGVSVPVTFEEFPEMLANVYNKLVDDGKIQRFVEPPVPKVPIDYSWAQELGMIRKPASFISTICDDRGQELLYAGMAISEVFKNDIGVGGVLGLLWFKRSLPAYAGKFIEMILMLTADHGPAVSGAHNTIVTARAGKDLVSSLVSGLLTIGDRFGGALDGAAQMFSSAYDRGLSPQDFVNEMRKSHQLILGIGHKIKSRTNPDLRVTIIRDFALKNFPNCDLLNYALKVEQITTSKKENLILNVDGCVGVAFVDLMRGCGAFSMEESEEYVSIGALNGLFVLGRSIGFIGHFLDQKRLKQGLYRHPWDDITYMSAEPAELPGRTLARPDENLMQHGSAPPS